MVAIVGLCDLLVVRLYLPFAVPRVSEVLLRVVFISFYHGAEFLLGLGPGYMGGEGHSWLGVGW